MSGIGSHPPLGSPRWATSTWMLDTRRFSLLFALATASLFGCYASHLPGEAPDAGFLRDGGSRDARARDSGRRRDAASPSCRPVELSTACVDDSFRPFLSSRGPTSLLLWTDDCHCGGELACSVRVEGGSIELETSVCDEDDCRACTAPNELRCEIPPVESGPHTVLVNGERAFELHAMDSGGVPPTMLCQHVGSSGGGLCDFPGHSMAWRPNRVCFRDRAPRGAIDIVFEGDGTSCAFEPGPCDVYASDTGLEIRPRVRSCDEGTSTWGCVGMSGRLRRVCRLLDLGLLGPLPMWLQDGTSLGTITITDGETGEVSCHSLAP